MAENDSGAKFIAWVIVAIIFIPIGLIWLIAIIIRAWVKSYRKKKFKEKMDALVGHNIMEAVFMLGIPTGTFTEGGFKIYEWSTVTVNNQSKGSSYTPLFFNFGNERVHSRSGWFQVTNYICSVAADENGTIISWRSIVR